VYHLASRKRVLTGLELPGYMLGARGYSIYTVETVIEEEQAFDRQIIHRLDLDLGKN
jgi:hypothetical protein